MKISNIVILVAVIALTVSILAFVNQPHQEPPWLKRIPGYAFSPMREGQSALDGGEKPSKEEVHADLALLSDKAHAIRIYTVDGILGEVPAMADEHNLNVNVGAWIDTRIEKNEQELKRFIEIVNKNAKNTVRTIVGNEVVLRGDISTELLISYIDQVRSQIDVPVSTAEPWHIWLKHPELAEHVDFIAVHMLPYWEGIDVELSIDYIVDKMNELKQAFPGKPIVITEVGWPSNGRARKAAVASQSNQAMFLRRFVQRAQQEHYVYYIMEAFDQPWKSKTEGSVGAYWGVYDVQRKPKFPFETDIIMEPHWYFLAAIAVISGAIILVYFLKHSNTLQSRGSSFFAIVVFAAANLIVWVIHDYLQQYMTITGFIVGLLLIIGMIGVVAVLIAEAHEWAEAHWVKGRRRAFKLITMERDQLPIVSIHVPAYNEPPEMVIETLNALAELDYPNFEVIFVDNNTRDPEVWQPVQAHCETLGSRFRFFHVSPLEGFKAGALNFALKHTSEDASIIAVIDSDYVVNPDWLITLVPQFTIPKIAIVQAPQDYRDDNLNAFKSMCYAEYKGFFFIGMITRNERNAIIQHGTMTLIRRDVLHEVNGWGEWCITEDADLGLRIFERGYEAIYVPQSFGRGLMPDNFNDYQKQRFRWAYGAIQIIRHHAGILFGWKKSKLTTGQRYHFLAGWLPWVADGFNLVFNLAALAWSIAMIAAPLKYDPPVLIFSLVPIALFIFKSAKLIYLYQTRIDSTMMQTMAAGLAGIALSHTISKAILLGFVTRKRPFSRTPKLAGMPVLIKSLAAVREETLMLTALLMAATFIALQQTVNSTEMMMWVIVLLIQCLPYFAALVVSVISGFPNLSPRLIGHTDAGPKATLPDENAIKLEETKAVD